MKKNNQSNIKIRFIVLTLSIVLAAVTGIGGTYAYLSHKTSTITNTFSYAKVTCSINEQFDGVEKKDVTVTNTGNIDAYIRCRIVVNWQNSEGIAAIAPVNGKDYNLQIGNGWTENGGSYVYNKIVKPKASTDVLITSCKEIEGRAPKGYHLSVEILADAIQSNPIEAKQQAWGN